MADALQLNVGMPWNQNGGAAVTFASFNLNGTTDALEFITQAREATVITQVWFRLNAVTGSSPVYRASIQGVDASGNPDGTIKGGGSPASKTFTPSGSGTWQKITLDNAYTCARGEMLAFVMDYSSGTIDGSNFASMTTSLSNNTGSDFPIAQTNDAGSRSRLSTFPCFGFASASKAYGNPVLAAAAQAINSGATSEAGCKFSLTAPASGTYTIAGVRIWMGTLVAAKTLAVKLYSGGGAGDTTVLQDVAWDSDWNSSVLTALESTISFDEATLATLNFGDTYRIALSTTDANNQNIQGFSVAAAADLEAFRLGQQMTLTTRSGGSWTDTATTRLFMELILADITAASGGGAPSFGMGAHLFRGRP